MDPQRLTPDLRQLSGRFDWTRPVVHFALTARREPDSGFVSRLKESERAQPEREECDKAPACGAVEQKPEHGEDGSDREHDEAEPAPTRLAARSDIRDDGDG